MDRDRKLNRYNAEPGRQRYCSLDDTSSSSSSSSSSTTTTQNFDKRIATAPSSVAVSGDNSTASLTVYSTDAGSVHDSFGFASGALKDAVDFVQNTLNKANDQVSAAIGQTLDVVTKSEAHVADAYATAKAGEQKILVGVGLVIAGIVAVAALRGFSHG